MAALRIATLLCPPLVPLPPPEEQVAVLAPRPGEFSWTLLPRNGQRPLYLPARMLLEASSQGAGATSGRRLRCWRRRMRASSRSSATCWKHAA
ncbi:hypothetical protein [Teichococcus aestuarii]|uniref:hypothetical protein n=1 Tax=Teichococcus aestuarii TaxID=568898 RepID=UPI0036182206